MYSHARDAATVAAARNAATQDLYQQANDYLRACWKGNAATHTLGAFDPGWWYQTEASRVQWDRIRDEWNAATTAPQRAAAAAKMVQLAVATGQSLPGSPPVPAPLVAAAGLKPPQIIAPPPPITFGGTLQQHIAGQLPDPSTAAVAVGAVAVVVLLVALMNRRR